MCSGRTSRGGRCSSVWTRLRPPIRLLDGPAAPVAKKLVSTPVRPAPRQTRLASKCNKSSSHSHQQAGSWLYSSASPTGCCPRPRPIPSAASRTTTARRGVVHGNAPRVGQCSPSSRPSILPSCGGVSTVPCARTSRRVTTSKSFGLKLLRHLRPAPQPAELRAHPPRHDRVTRGRSHAHARAERQHETCNTPRSTKTDCHQLPYARSVRRCTAFPLKKPARACASPCVREPSPSLCARTRNDSATHSGYARPATQRGARKVVDSSREHVFFLDG